MQLWQITDQTTSPVLLNGPVDIRATHLGADGRWLFVAGCDSRVARLNCTVTSLYLWAMHNQSARILTAVGNIGDVEAMAFSPDGHWLVVAVCDEEKDHYCTVSTASLWDLRNASRTAVSLPLGERLRQIAATRFSPDGNWLAVLRSDGMVLLWSTDKLADYPEVLPTNSIDMMAFSPDGQWLLTAQFASLQLWNLSNLSPISLSHCQRITCAFCCKLIVEAEAKKRKQPQAVSDERTEETSSSSM